jgi:hypothetical protein
LEIAGTNQNYFYEYVNSTLYVVNDCCRSFLDICPVGKLEDEHTIINMIFPINWNVKLGLLPKEAKNVRV